MQEEEILQLLLRELQKNLEQLIHQNQQLIRVIDGKISIQEALETFCKREVAAENLNPMQLESTVPKEKKQKKKKVRQKNR